MSSSVYFGGRPTGPDVDKLLKAFEDVKPGEVVRHEEIARVLDAKVGSTRYKTVQTRWRAALFDDRNQATVAEPGIGIRFLRENERAADAKRTAVHGTRKIRRAHSKASAIRLQDLETEREKTAAVLTQRVLEGMAKGARDALKEFGKTFPHVALPQRQPPKD